MKTRWFFLFFFVSGFCSLVYEVVWLRLSMAKFGVTTPMVSIVLSVFMAGLGLGSWLGGIVIRRFESRGPALPLRLYGMLELLIGVSAFAAPATINLGYGLLRDAGRGVAWGSGFYYLASGGWVAVALLPWCTCMGATFPFAMAAIRRVGGESEHSFSYLYLANVLGAVLGTLLPAIVLIELYGFRGTLYVACAMNVLLAAAVFAVSSSLPESGAIPAPPEPAARSAAPLRKDLLWMLFATGICSMAMEVAWIREYTVYLGNVVYAFAAILAIYLLATYLGSTIYRRRVRQGKPADGSAAWVYIGCSALLPLFFADPRIPDVDSHIWEGLRALFGIGPFSALAGYLTPMLVDRWSKGAPDRAGRAYSVNVLGSILGPLVSGFAVIPLVGERWGLCLIAIPLFAIGAWNAARQREWRPAGRIFAATAVLALAIAVFTRGYESLYPNRVELRDSTATVIATGAGMDRELLVNGIGMTRLTTITKMMAHMPLAMLPKAPQRGLVICFGMGTSFRSMLTWNIQTTVVDLVPSVPKLFGYFHDDAPRVAASPDAHIVVDDGRRFLERSNELYDVIVTDPPPPVYAPTSSLLYSEEFYSVLKRRLQPWGIAQIWAPGGDDATLASITKALQRSFPYLRAYESIEGWGIHFLGSLQPLSPPAAADLAARLPAAAARDLMEWQKDGTPAKLFTGVLGAEQSLTDYTSADPAIPPITDDRPINEYFLLRRLRGE